MSSACRPPPHDVWHVLNEFIHGQCNPRANTRRAHERDSPHAPDVVYPTSLFWVRAVGPTLTRAGQQIDERIE